jgi:peptidoglycan/xylan/chitin deacetylase (PgdA/CDA1 family)
MLTDRPHLLFARTRFIHALHLPAAFLFLGAVLIAITIMACDTPDQDTDSEPLAVLGYHLIGNDSDDYFNISESAFRKQMKYLSRNGYNTIPLDDFTAWMMGKGRLPSKPLLMTFDDGHASDYKIAYPILKEYGFTGTSFVIADYIGKEGKLSTGQLMEMLQNGFSVGSHGLNHLALVSGMEKSFKFEETFGSKIKLEKMLNRKIDYISYPFGTFDKEVEKLLLSFGFKGAFTTIPGINKRTTNLYELRRILINKSMDLETFAGLINGDKRLLASKWAGELPNYVNDNRFRPAEIEINELLEFDPGNAIALNALQAIKAKREDSEKGKTH